MVILSGISLIGWVLLFRSSSITKPERGYYTYSAEGRKLKLEGQAALDQHIKWCQAALVIPDDHINWKHERELWNEYETQIARHKASSEPSGG